MLFLGGDGPRWIEDPGLGRGSSTRGLVWILPPPSSCVTRATLKTLNNQKDRQRPIRTGPALNTRCSQICVPAKDSGTISASRGLDFSICSKDTVIPLYRTVVETELLTACKKWINQRLAHRKHPLRALLLVPSLLRLCDSG